MSTSWCSILQTKYKKDFTFAFRLDYLDLFQLECKTLFIQFGSLVKYIKVTTTQPTTTVASFKAYSLEHDYRDLEGSDYPYDPNPDYPNYTIVIFTLKPFNHDPEDPNGSDPKNSNQEGPAKDSDPENTDHDLYKPVSVMNSLMTLMP